MSIDIGDKVKVVYKVYEDKYWNKEMDTYIGDDICTVTNTAADLEGVERAVLNYTFSFPKICLEVIEKSPFSNPPTTIQAPSSFEDAYIYMGYNYATMQPDIRVNTANMVNTHGNSAQWVVSRSGRLNSLHHE